MPNTPRHSLRAPADLWAAFLVATKKRGDTATSALVRFMREYVASNQ